jgi:uridine nucleosidase
VSGESGLDGVTLLPQPIEPAVTDVDYLEAMYKALISTAPDTAWLVSTGTLTNIGLLFQRYPDLAGHLKGVSIMGGAVGGGFTDAPMGKVKGEGERFGNWTAYAEFNVSRDYTKAILSANTNTDLCKQVVGCANTIVADTKQCDPEASHFIFSHPILKSKTTLIPLDLSHQVLGTKAVRHTQLYGSDTPLDAASSENGQTPSALRALFTQIMSFFAGTYAEVFSITEGPPLHDPLAVSAAIYPEIFNDQGGERFQVDIVTEGVHSMTQSDVGELGRTKVKKLPPGEGGCRIPRGVDLVSFWASIESALRRADAVSPMPKIPREDLERDGVFVGID